MGREEALASGFAGVTLACEPTGHRWKVVAELAAAAGIELVCVQPLLVARARESEDFTRDKSDDKDALLIARLATQLHVYLPEQADATWARLRHLGARRVERVTQVGAARQQLRDLLECAWPAALGTAAHPLDSLTWRAAMAVAGCDPARVRQLGLKGSPARSPRNYPGGAGNGSVTGSWARCTPPPPTPKGCPRNDPEPSNALGSP